MKKIPFNTPQKNIETDFQIVNVAEKFNINIPDTEIEAFLQKLTPYMDESSLGWTMYNLKFAKNLKPNTRNLVAQKSQQVKHVIKTIENSEYPPEELYEELKLDIGYEDTDYEKYMFKNLIEILHTFFEDTFLRNAESMMDHPDPEIKKLVTEKVEAVVALRTEFYNKVLTGVLKKQF